MKDFILIALACAAISFTISITSIFRSFRAMLSWSSWLSELFHCPWCLNHYVVLFFMLCGATNSLTLVEFFLNWFGLVGAGGVVHFLLLRAYESVPKRIVQEKIDILKSNSGL